MVRLNAAFPDRNPPKPSSSLLSHQREGKTNQIFDFEDSVRRQHGNLFNQALMRDRARGFVRSSRNKRVQLGANFG